MVEPAKISKLAIGTWGIGGFGQKGVNTDESKHLRALERMFEYGANYIDLSLKYADGYTLQIAKKFINKVGRENLFISVKLENPTRNQQDIAEYVAQYKKLLGTTYLDLLQLHAPAFTTMSLEEVHHYMLEFVESGDVLYLGASNLDLQDLRLIHKVAGDKLIAFESLFNFDIRINEENGILDYCKQNSILFLAYQPLMRTKTIKKNYQILNDLSSKYQKTQSQIIINWLCQKGLVPLIRSDSLEHIQENFNALEFQLDSDDLRLIESFHIYELSQVKIDWKGKGEGVSIWRLPDLM